jgi:hypothetical protein
MVPRDPAVMKIIAHTVTPTALGLQPDQSVAELKSRLGVEKLDVVVLSSIEEYEELLVPAPEVRYVKVRLGWMWVAIAALFFFMIFGRNGIPVWDLHHFLWERLGDQIL